MNYLIVAPEFAAQYEGYSEAENALHFIPLLDGRCACPVVSAQLFPDVFADQSIETIELTDDVYAPKNTGIATAN